MRNLILASAAALAVLPAITNAAEGEWRPGVRNCRPTLERWIDQVATNEDGSSRFINGYIQSGAFLAGEIRWRDGVVVEVQVGPHGDLFCQLASRYISGGPEQQASVQ